MALLSIQHIPSNSLEFTLPGRPLISFCSSEILPPDAKTLCTRVGKVELETTTMETCTISTGTRCLGFLMVKHLAEYGHCLVQDVLQVKFLSL